MLNARGFRILTPAVIGPVEIMQHSLAVLSVCYSFDWKHGRQWAMRRRDFIGLLGGAAAWPVDALAQQASKVWRMGFIAHGHEPFYDALFEGLREYGYDEGRNLIVERRYARGQAERFKEFAAEMVRLKVDIIIVVTTPAALAVMNATKTIPIVHPNAIDPLNTGLIASLAHPGGMLREVRS
jgi:putative tryptophan/tyrosine transport system substrate-binding protein